MPAVARRRGALPCRARRGAQALRPYVVVGDAIPASLTGAPGDPARGRAIVRQPQQSACLLCHSGPFPEERFQGDLAPNLAGAGSALVRGPAAAADGRCLPPQPGHDHAVLLSRRRARRGSAPAWRGKPILTAEQIEDVVAYLATLRE